ncbi:MAG: hypothetical protein IKQ46_12145 [Bacteroidales bacterium]|nr:hypothetical protein [Bacteroidales bacterium]
MRHNFFIILILLFASCTGAKSDLDIALELAGENRPELETVLVHSKSDPEKLAAAKFLIENMPAHYSYKSNEIDGYYASALKNQKWLRVNIVFTVKFMLKFTTKINPRIFEIDGNLTEI